MALEEKLFEESGNITGLKIIKVHPIEGVTTEISFTSEIRGEDRSPNGQNLGSGIMTKYPHGIIDSTWHGSLMSAQMEHLSYEIGTPTSTVTTGAILIATAAATGKYTR